MKKTKILGKKIKQIVILAFTIFIIFLIPSAIFNLDFAKFLLSNVPYLLVTGVLSIKLAAITSANRKLGALLILIFAAIFSFIVIIIKIMDSVDAEKVEWNADNDSFTMDFFTGNQGHIYLKAAVNDTSGLFLFDTGSAMSIVNEKFVLDKKMRLHPYTIHDVKGLQQTKHLYKVKNFELGDLVIKQMQVYPADSLTWSIPKGTFYGQDSVIGLIGNNLISKFIWDFDMVNKKVTLSKSKKYTGNFPDSLSMPLYANHGNKDIPVKINGVEQLLTFDFGSSRPLSLKDTIPNLSEGQKIGGSGNQKGLLNHVDTYGKDQSNFSYANVALGPYKFNEIQCYENEHAAIFGLPFIWSFERVIVDYLHDKVFFIHQNDHSNPFGVSNFKHENLWNNARVIRMTSKPEGFPIIIQHDSTQTRFVVYGTFTLYKNEVQLDSVFYQDSILKPDKQMKHGPSTVRITSTELKNLP